ncbi:MAG: ABC transporter permease [Pseudomonadota bacterium]
MTGLREMGVRRFGRWNTLGLYELTRREIMRFMSVWTQTVLAPLVTSGLFLAVFALAIGPSRGEVMGVPFLQFLAPGILMMTVIQNAFANTSSSLMVGKIQGNIVDTLMPPLSSAELVIGYIAGGIARGLLVAVAILFVMVTGLGVPVTYPLWILAFVILGSAFLGALGLVAAIVAEKFDHMAAITNFVITPLAFLSGTFYSTEGLPPAMQVITHLNPVFYLIDGVRFGVLGVSDSSPWLGLGICVVTTFGVLILAWHWFRIGYRLKS